MALRTSIATRLIRWYERHRRDLPWRRRGDDAYAQMVAELMLQQTQVATVIGYYERFMTRFPTAADLARADINDVLALWSGLGYYRRARHLHAAARKIVDEYGGEFPRDVATLMRLPGIGRYTAGAIASIAYDARAPLLDGNVMRVLMRLLAMDEDPRLPMVRAKLWEVAESLLPKTRCGDFNQGLMELGATLCRPVAPACVACPLRGDCAACRDGLTERIPRAVKRAAVRKAGFAVAALAHEDALLFVQRPMQGLWAGLWELPSEAVESGESPLDARKRLRSRLPAGCRLSSRIAGRVSRQLTHREVTFHVFKGVMANGGGREVAPARWLQPSDLQSLGLSQACRAILDVLGWGRYP